MQRNAVNCYIISSHRIYTAQSLRPETVVYVFENLHRNFANLVALSTDETTKTSMHCKVHLVR